MWMGPEDVRVRNERASSHQGTSEIDTDNQIMEHGCPMDD